MRRFNLLIMPKLYAAQAAGVSRFACLPSPRRFIFPWKTGCGKTAASLTIMGRMIPDTYIAPRTLIVCPAVVRNHWWREVGKWVGQEFQEQAAELTVGRARKLPSKPAVARRVKAYASRIQIVSYDLLAEVDPSGWELIIFDELHHLASPRSKQSKLARALVKANNSADILGLSATLIPTEVKQLWHPLRLIFGEAAWGKLSKTGEANWDFLFRYCHIERSEYGVMARGLNYERVGELRDRLAPLTYPLSREDIVKDLPPLDVQLLQLPAVRSAPALVAQLTDWAEQFDPDDVTKLVILVRHRALAGSIHKALAASIPAALVSYVDGSITPSNRAVILDRCAAAPRAILVGTHEALSEGIRLMWVQQALIAEWSQSPGRITQLLGRFNSVGHTSRPQVTMHCSGSNYGAAVTLINRLKDVTALLSSTATEDKISEVFGVAAKADIITEDAWGDMFASALPDAWKESHDET